MTGTVQSGLLPTPIAISNSSTRILLAAGNPSQDSFMPGSPVKVIGTTLTITANSVIPKGTITNDHVLPFIAPVTLTPSNATATYSDGTNATIVWDQRNADSHGGGKYGGRGCATAWRRRSQAITTHADGAQSVQSIAAWPVDLGEPSDVVVLQFYASGVRDAAEVRVQIGGEEGAVLYAGAADRFSGLDQVSVQVPRSLAERGEVEVRLTADGQTAGPVRLQIQ
jgi:uncharacterized protein (TIGR03437 family)